jgi:predicted Zn-dependent protease
MGRNDAAVQLLTEMLPRHRNADGVQAVLGEVYYEQAKYFESASSYNSGIKARPNSALYAAGFARTLLVSNRPGEAIVAARSAVRLAAEFR